MINKVFLYKKINSYLKMNTHENYTFGWPQGYIFKIILKKKLN
jgi:hypothetical protein